MQTATKNPTSRTAPAVRIVNGNAWYADLKWTEGKTLEASRVQGDVTNPPEIRKALQLWAAEKGYTFQTITLAL